MPALTFVNSAFAESGGATSLVVSKPTDTADGDLLIAVASVYGASLSYPTAPAGWDSRAQNDSSGGGFEWRQRVWTRVASSEGANYTWSFSGLDPPVCSILVLAFRGYFNTYSLIDVVSNTAYTTSDTTCRAASVTVAQADSHLFFIGLGEFSSTMRTFTPPTNPSTFTEVAENGTATSYLGTEVAYLFWTSSGATGNIDATISAAVTRKHAFALVVKPMATGAVAFAAASSLSAVPTRTRKGAVAFTSTSLLTAAGKRSRLGATALSAASLMVASGNKIKRAAAALSASSLMTAAGDKVKAGTATFGAASAMVASGWRQRKGAVSFVAQSLMSVIGLNLSGGKVYSSAASTVSYSAASTTTSYSSAAHEVAYTPSKSTTYQVPTKSRTYTA